MMEINKTLIGAKIRKLREDNDWTQAELGNKIGLSQSSITEIETGKKLASMKVIDSILSVFNISFDFLFADALLAFQSNEKDYFYEQLKANMAQMDYSELELFGDLICRFVQYEKNK